MPSISRSIDLTRRANSTYRPRHVALSPRTDRDTESVGINPSLGGAARRVIHARPEVLGVSPSRRHFVTSSPMGTRQTFARSAEENRMDLARPFPAMLEPLARRILGDAALPSISAGPRTARVLKGAGVEAATHQSTIYLDRPPGTDTRMAAVLAHELVHVAHGGDHPRFLGDELVDAEETRAVGAAAAVSSVALSSLSPSATPVPASEEPATAGAVEAFDFEALLDRLSDRVLVEIERRGGRYAGMF